MNSNYEIFKVNASFVGKGMHHFDVWVSGGNVVGLKTTLATSGTIFLYAFKYIPAKTMGRYFSIFLNLRVV